MNAGWYLLSALAAEWNGRLAGSTIVDLHSAARDELTVLLDNGREVDGIRISVRPGDRYVLRQADATRPRRNVTTLLGSARSRVVRGVTVAERDRLVDFGLDDGSVLRIVLFGPRANVVHGRDPAGVIASFRENVAVPGTPMPSPLPAPDPVTPADVRARWPGESMDLARAVARTWPLFDSLMAAEVVARAGLRVHDACLVETHDFERLARAAASVRADALAPRPVLWRNGRQPVALALVPSSSPPAPDAQRFDTVDEAVRVFVRATLAERAFRAEAEPLVRLLASVVERNRTRGERMREELAAASRADRWERFGHLLSAAALPETPGRDSVTLPDLFESGAPVEVPLDPARTPLDNARRYYERARNVRRARETASDRLERAADAERTAGRLLRELEVVRDREGLKDFRARHAGDLARFAFERPADAAPLPFRRFDLGRGYEVWVGRNARENDTLTFTHARKHDWWLHARGVPGSHVVLRVPRRERPPAAVLETAASIAARFSKASGSGLVPVIVVERRYVRKPRGAEPGAVVVEREEVLIVPPHAGAEP